MYPWKVSFGLTCTLAALAVLFGFERLAFLRPYASLIWEQYSGLILAHLLVLFLSVAAGIHYLARLAGPGRCRPQGRAGRARSPARPGRSRTGRRPAARQ